MIKKRTLLTFAVSVCAVIAFSLVGAAGEGKTVDSLDAKIKTVIEGMDKDCGKMFNLLMESITAALPQTGYPEAFKKDIVTAAGLFKENGILDGKGVQLINRAYRSINHGKDSSMPEVESIEDARDYVKRIAERSRIYLKKGSTDKAVRQLLKTVIMITTPMKKKT
jgi:hypothetical protein